MCQRRESDGSIEITPAMIDAGVRVLEYEYDPEEPGSGRKLVLQIYRAMLSVARGRSGRQ